MKRIFTIGAAAAIRDLHKQNKHFNMTQHSETTAKFTLEQLLAAHAKVKTGADFPKYIREIKALGLVTYEFAVKDGSIVYHGNNGYEVKGHSKYEPLTIHTTADARALKHTIAIHQQGKTDFLTFCHQAAQAGVEKWIIDTPNMVCNYVDLHGNVMVAEPIPDAGY